jgi:hypothetical protein
LACSGSFFCDTDPRYRIVYRLLPDEDEPTKAEVVRIGLKIPYGEEEQNLSAGGSCA